MKLFAALTAALAGIFIYFGMAYPFGLRFAMGIWPVPPGTPWSYQLESGFIPALTVLTLLSLVSGAWKHVNCHHPWCWRTGKHKVNGTPWCSVHECEARPERTDNEILQSIEAALASLAEVLRDK